MPEDYQRPKALIYWRNEAGFSKYLAIYVDSAEMLGNYVPLHSSVLPVDEENMERLRMEMDRIGADLFDAGSINPHSNPEKFPEAIFDYLRRKSSGEYVKNDIVGADDIAYSLWTEEECLKYFTGLVGRLRDVLDDPVTRDNIAAEITSSLILAPKGAGLSEDGIQMNIEFHMVESKIPPMQANFQFAMHLLPKGSSFQCSS